MTERQTKERSGNEASLSMGTLRRDRGGRAPLLRTLKDIQRKALEMASFSIGAPLGDQGGDAALPGTLRER